MATERAYTAGDIIAQLLAGNTAYNIAVAYLVYQNTAAAVSLVPARADTADTFHTLGATYDFIRVPVLQSPVISAVDANHNGNRALFTIIGQGSVGMVNGLPFNAASDSHVVNVALLAAPGATYLNDVLYSHSSLASALPVLGAGQIGATYALEID